MTTLGTPPAEAAMFSSSLTVSTINKHYLTVKASKVGLCTVEIEAGRVREKYFLKLQKKNSLFILRTISGENKLIFSAPFPIEVAITQRLHKRRPLKVKLYEILDDIRRRRGIHWPDIRTSNGMELREITPGRFMPEAASDDERIMFHRFRDAEPEISLLSKGQPQELFFSTDILADILDWLNDETGSDFGFFANAEKFSESNRSAVQYYLEQCFGKKTDEGPAMRFMRANPNTGMISFGIAEAPSSVHHNRRAFRRTLALMNMHFADVETSPTFPSACLLRKSALKWISAMNIERRDVETGLYDAPTLLKLIPSLVRKAGFGIVPIPFFHEELLIGRPVTEASWVQFRSISDPKRKNICLFVGLLGKDGKFAPHALAYMRALKEQGLYLYALGVSLSPPETACDPGKDFCDAFAARENDGHDFGLWAAALQRQPELWEAETLLFANDSMIPGPSSLNNLFEKLSLSPYDVTGLTDSTIGNPHLQSYFIHLNRQAIETAAVRKFWYSVLSLTDKSRIINLYEIGMTAKFSAAGLKCGPLFSASSAVRGGDRNPSIYCWKELIQSGFPFVKTQIIKDATASNTTDEVLTFLKNSGFNLEIIPGYTPPKHRTL
ncbi:rhamnan synthesis F family protein [Agrobacterium sp. P15N1-A]|uniref:rhamnan synthesis F family protein n=1 Tax=Agrobacterium sp. P15N1-A TaxID=3342820 RepID=UPI0037D912FF